MVQDRHIVTVTG